MKAKGGEEAVKKNVQLAEDGSWGLSKVVSLSADIEAAAGSLESLAKIVNEGGHTKQQTVNADQTDFYWKKMPSLAIIAREEKSTPDFKASENGWLSY